ncbi:MAG: DNA polymerase III subunit delta' [Actinobacteria bacterium]|nr:MAG: DNA polymerase III subunit delta' [Actinomycetota bacterium]
MIFKSIVGQDQALSKLKKDISLKTITHAYLFFGPDGIGKKMMAKSFAKAIICPNGGDTCNCCQRIEKEIHPDCSIYTPEGNFVTIDEVREITRLASMVPMEAKTRVIILDEADCLTEPAANALLKTLEEPPGHNVFILITSNVDAVIPTILSRCRLVKFNTIKSNLIKEVLNQKFSLTKDEIEQICRLCGGVLASATQMASNPWHLKLRGLVLDYSSGRKLAQPNDFVNEMMELCKKSANESLENNIDNEIISQQFAVDRSHLSHLKKVIKQKEKRQAAKQSAKAYEEALDYLASWYRDLLVYSESKSSDLLINLDYFDEIQKSCQNVDGLDKVKSIEDIQSAQKLIRLNVNTHLVMENLLMNLN